MLSLHTPDNANSVSKAFGSFFQHIDKYPVFMLMQWEQRYETLWCLNTYTYIKMLNGEKYNQKLLFDYGVIPLNRSQALIIKMNRMFFLFPITILPSSYVTHINEMGF